LCNSNDLVHYGSNDRSAEVLLQPAAKVTTGFVCEAYKFSFVLRKNIG